MTAALNDDELLSAVQSRPALYDKANKDHCNREIVRKLWREISQETGAEILTCKTRWNSMRDYFLRKYREGARPGQPLASGKRLWPYFELLSFLVPHVSTREPGTPQENPDEGEGISLNSLMSPKDSFMGKCEVEETANNPPGSTTCNSPSISSKQEPPSRSPSPVESELTHTAAVTPTVRPSSSQPFRIARKRKGTPAGAIDHKTFKTVRNEESSHEHFFRSILPMIERFSDIETLMFRSDVHGLVLKYLQKQEALPVITSAVSQASDAAGYSVYLQADQSPE